MQEILVVKHLLRRDKTGIEFLMFNDNSIEGEMIQNPFPAVFAQFMPQGLITSQLDHLFKEVAFVISLNYKKIMIGCKNRVGKVVDWC
jgi:hypothetical protein